MTVVDGLEIAAALVAGTLALLRWLRVAERVHYLPGAAIRFAWRWWRKDGPDLALLVVAGVATVGSGFVAAFGFATAVVGAVGPFGLSLRGRTAKLAWTRRLRAVAAFAVTEVVAAVIIGGFVGGGHAAAVVATVGVLFMAAVVDLALVVDRPIEQFVTHRYVQRANERLARIAPTVVAITGSYGKTTTKRFVAHLLGGSRAVVASPASFNNRIGLARAINESLAPGTEVFVAEMGAYGPGEIAELTRWLKPRISVITAIGPVHLERFGSLERTLAAKAEIVEGAEVAVLNVDDPRLAGLAGRLVEQGRSVRRASALEAAADVAVLATDDRLALLIGGSRVGDVALETPRPLALSNVACAAAVALEFGVEASEVLARLATLPVVEHRLSGARSQSGVAVLDDTFNSNPAGARLALEALGRAEAPGRRVVVTPGMVELGRVQHQENSSFAKEVSERGFELIIVGRTNRRALLDGDRPDGPPPRTVRTRDEAVDWVRRELGPGDAVLYENDLPDHFP